MKRRAARRQRYQYATTVPSRSTSVCGVGDDGEQTRAIGTIRLKGVVRKRRATPNLSFVWKTPIGNRRNATTDVNGYIPALRKAQYVLNAMRGDVLASGNLGTTWTLVASKRAVARRSGRQNDGAKDRSDLCIRFAWNRSAARFGPAGRRAPLAPPLRLPGLLLRRRSRRPARRSIPLRAASSLRAPRQSKRGLSPRSATGSFRPRFPRTTCRHLSSLRGSAFRPRERSTRSP